MTFVIEQTIEVTATPAVVWEVIVDLPRYGEWNPFVVECRSTLAVGDPIDMRVHVFAAAHMPGDNSRRSRPRLLDDNYICALTTITPEPPNGRGGVAYLVDTPGFRRIRPGANDGRAGEEAHG